MICVGAHHQLTACVVLYLHCESSHALLGLNSSVGYFSFGKTLPHVTLQMDMVRQESPSAGNDLLMCSCSQPSLT